MSTTRTNTDLDSVFSTDIKKVETAKPRTRRTRMSRDKVTDLAVAVLALLTGLSAAQKRRVLRRAGKIATGR